MGAEGAKAYLRDLPNAELHLLDGGHFALETHGDEIADLIRDFLARKVGSEARSASGLMKGHAEVRQRGAGTGSTVKSRSFTAGRHILAI